MNEYSQEDLDRADEVMRLAREVDFTKLPGDMLRTVIGVLKGAREDSPVLTDADNPRCWDEAVIYFAYLSEGFKQGSGFYDK